MPAKALIIGIGNADRGDDAVGRVVARRLKEQNATDLHVVENQGDTARLVDLLGSTESACVIDASLAGGPAGTVRRFDVSATELPQDAVACSTHGMGLAEAIELTRALRRMPRNCVIYLIEGQNYQVGAPLSREVAAAVDEAANLIRAELRQWEILSTPCKGGRRPHDTSRRGS